MSDPAKTIDQNILPVQALFNLDNTFNTFIGQGQPFYATLNPVQSGLTITNSTIDSTTIGATTPSTGVFTNISTTTGQISTTPSSNTDIANKFYVDTVAQGLGPKAACQVATTANITLSGIQTIDGYTISAGDRVLVKNQATSANNGIYIASSGTWSRSTDMDVWSEVPGAYTVILNGSANIDTAWVCTASTTGTIGTTPMPWVQFANVNTYTAGTGLTLASNQFSITNTGVTAGSYGSASQSLTAIVNAQGQLTSLSAQNIALNANQITSGTIASSLISGSYTGITGVGTLTAGTWNANTIGVAYGGTGATTFTAGYLKASGTSAFSTVSTIPNTDITGLGTMSTQNANAVSITGGSATLTTLITSGLTGYLYGNNGSAVTASTTIPTSALSGNFVSTFSAGTTGFTPSSNTAGIITLAGTLNVANGGSGVTTSSGANSIVLRDANGNITTNCLFEGYVTQAASGTTITLTASTAQNYQITGSGGQTIKLPDATTLPNGATFTFNNNQTSGAITVVNNSSTTIATIQSGGYTTVVLLSNTPAAGSWDKHDSTPSNVSWSTNTFDYPGSITSATWNGSTIAYNRGGTGQSSAFVVGGVVYGSTTSALAVTAAGTTGQFLQSNGSGAPTWATPVSYATVTDDTTTNGTRYPLFANQTSGNLATEYTSSTKLQYNPSTGVFTSTSFSGAGTGLTGTASSLSIGGNAATATSATSATTATTATNLAGGANGSLPYQTGSGATTFLAAGSNTQILTLAGGVPTWANPPVTGITITDDTTTNATRYITFTSATSGTITTENTSSSKLQYNPSTGTLTATTFSGSIAGSNVSGNISGNAANVTGTVAIGNGGTGQTTASAGFNALSPLTTAGDILYGGTSGAGTRLGIGTSGQVLTVVSGLPAWQNVSGTGTVTSVSVVSANGFAGTVANATSTPAITLSTSITGVLKGNGTAISAATAGTDYSAGTSGNATGLVYSTTTTGALTTATAAQITTAIGTTAVTNATNAANVAVADTTTNAVYYPVISSSNTGNQAMNTSSSKLKYNPSTGALTVSQIIISP